MHEAKLLSTCSGNWVIVKGIKYQMTCALVIGQGEFEEELQFAKVVQKLCLAIFKGMQSTAQTLYGLYH